MSDTEMIILHILFFIFCIWQTILLFKHIKRLNVDKAISGELVLSVKRTPKAILFLGCLLGFYIFRFSGTIAANVPISLLLLFVLILIEAVILICMQWFLPVKIYEKGILHTVEGFIPWESIETIKKSDIKGEKIQFKRKGFQSDIVQFDCMPGIADDVVSYIKNRIKESGVTHDS